MELRINVRSVISAWLLVGIVLMPIYTWSSGGVQISHAVIFAGCLLVWLKRGIRMDVTAQILGLLAVYIALRDSVFVARHASWYNVLPILYIVFSWTLYASLRDWFADERNVTYLKYGLLLSAVVAILGVFIMGYGATVGSGERWRSIGTFNNPNQLGYFAVCLLSFGCLLYLRRKISAPLALVFVAFGLFLSTAALSKAAMVSCGFGAVLIGFAIGRSRTKVILGVLVATAAVAGAFWAVREGLLDDYKFFVRLSSIGEQSDDSLVGRGYWVLTEAGPMEFLFGFGAERVLEIVGHELHSTIASYFSNYGVLGGIPFLVVLFLWARRIYWDVGTIGLLVVVAPPMLYGLTHNGSRFTIFWLLLAYSLATPATAVRTRMARGFGSIQEGPQLAHQSTASGRQL